MENLNDFWADSDHRQASCYNLANFVLQILVALYIGNNGSVFLPATNLGDNGAIG